MAGIRIEGDTSGTVAEVDASKNILVNTPGRTAAGVSRGGGNDNAGGAVILTENDGGSLTGARSVKAPKASLDRRLRVGLDTLLFDDTFNATTQNTSVWAYTFATLTASQPGAGTLNFGTVQGTASTHGAFMRTFQYFPLMGEATLAAKIDFGQFGAALVANEEWRAGFALPTVAGTAPTDGIWVKLTSAGLIGEAVFNGVTTPTATLAAIGSFTVGEMITVDILVGEAVVEFWKDDVLLGSLAPAAANGQPFQQVSLPFFMQKICTGAVSNTNTMRVADVNIFTSDIQTTKAWGEQMAIMGRSAYIGQNGSTQGKTSLWTNSTAPTAVALTNTAAAFTGLGGIVAVLPTLAANSDGKLLTYQNPAGTINITGRNLVIKAVKIQGTVSVILTGGPVNYAFALAFGHTATSLATAETGSFVTATTHAPRIQPLGFEAYAVTAAAGTIGQGVLFYFDSPVVVRPGEFVDIIARNIGTVTTLGAITYVIGFDAYFE